MALGSVNGLGLELDGRGLIKLDVARKIVRGATEFRKVNADGGATESDILWGALMSLEDADEFVREGTRLHWTFHPRKSSQRDPVERYGEGALPWLRSFVHDGVLVNVPWCITACLNALGSVEAFSLLMGLKDVIHYEGEPGQPGPFAHPFPFRFDREKALAERAPTDEPSDAAEAAVLEFCWENPHGTWAKLTAMSCDTPQQEAHPLAIRVLSAGAHQRPSTVFGYAVDSSKDEAFIRKVFGQMELPTGLTPEAVLALLDAACTDPEAWPYFYGMAPERAYHALRLTAAREKEDDAWFILFECLEGSELDGAPGQGLYIRRYMIKSDGGIGLLRGVGFPELKVVTENAAGIIFKGPRGSVTLTAQTAQKYLPLRATAQDVVDMMDTLAVRAYIAERGLPFLEISEMLEQIGLDADDYDILVNTTAFEHIVGTAGAEYDPEGIDAKWRVIPSDSAVYCSLAEAVAERNGAKFRPGVSNLDWRLHLDAENSARTGIDVGTPSAETVAAAQTAAAALSSGAGGDADPVVFPGKKLAKLSDYVGFMKKMQSGDMMGALAAYGLDMMSFGTVAQEWGAKMASDPLLAAKMAAMMSR